MIKILIMVCINFTSIKISCSLSHFGEETVNIHLQLAENKIVEIIFWKMFLQAPEKNTGSFISLFMTLLLDLYLHQKWHLDRKFHNQNKNTQYSARIIEKASIKYMKYTELTENKFSSINASRVLHQFIYIIYMNKYIKI